MDRAYIKDVTLHFDHITFGGDDVCPRYFVSRPCQGSFRDNQEFETLLFADTGVYLINADDKTLGPAIECWLRDPRRGPDTQPYKFSFDWETCGSAVWDPWDERVLFSCGSSQVLSLHGDTNEVSVLADFASPTGPAPRTCDLLALDPQNRGRLWVVTCLDGDDIRDDGGAIYELDLRPSAAPAPSAPPPVPAFEGSSDPQMPLPVTRARLVASFGDPLRAAVFDAARRLLLVATRSEIFGLPVDLWRWPDGPAEQDDGEGVEPEWLVGFGDADRLDGVVGLACDAASGSYYVVENVTVQSRLSRAGMDRSSIKRLELGWSPPAAAAEGTGAAGAVRHPAAAAASGSGGTAQGSAKLTTLIEANRVRWSHPYVLHDGRLAIVDMDEGIVLLNTRRGPLPLGRPLAGTCGRGEGGGSGGGGGGGGSRSLVADLGALLDSCLGPGGSGDVTLVAAGGVELRAHGAILMARCDYFPPLLAEGGGFGDSGSRRVQLHDVDAGVLRCVLRHIYTGEADLESLVLEQQQQQQPQGEEGRQQQQQQPQSGPGAVSDPLLALAEASDQLLLPDLCREAQRRVLERCAAAPAAHLVPDLLWAESRGSFGRLVTELKRMYVERAEELERAEGAAAAAAVAVAAHESRRRGHRHGNGGGAAGAATAGVGRVLGSRHLAASNPELAAELELMAATRKRRRAA